MLATQLCKDFLPCEAGACPLQVQRCDRQSAPSPAPGGLYRGFITQAGCVIILNAIPSPPPREGQRAPSFWSWPVLLPSGSPPRVTSLGQKMPLPPGKSLGTWVLKARTGVSCTPRGCSHHPLPWRGPQISFPHVGTEWLQGAAPPSVLLSLSSWASRRQSQSSPRPALSCVQVPEGFVLSSCDGNCHLAQFVAAPQHLQSFSGLTGPGHKPQRPPPPPPPPPPDLVCPPCSPRGSQPLLWLAGTSLVLSVLIPSVTPQTKVGPATEYAPGTWGKAKVSPWTCWASRALNLGPDSVVRFLND